MPGPLVEGLESGHEGLGRRPLASERVAQTVAKLSTPGLEEMAAATVVYAVSVAMPSEMVTSAPGEAKDVTREAMLLIVQSERAAASDVRSVMAVEAKATTTVKEASLVPNVLAEMAIVETRTGPTRTTIPMRHA